VKSTRLILDKFSLETNEKTKQDPFFKTIKRLSDAKRN
jgi:hypothetical protein